MALLAINEVAHMAPTMTSPVTDRDVPPSTKVAVHHAARFVAWKDTMLTDASSAMIGMNPRRNLQKLSPLRALYLAMTPLTGSWTRGFGPHDSSPLNLESLHLLHG